MLRFHVSNMSCGGCAKGVTRAIQGAVTGATVDVHLSSREVVVSGTNDEAAIVHALKRAGYQAESLRARAA